MAQVDLDDLGAFAAVARHLSFRAAARELGVSASTLSQRLRDLEDRLGTRLLNRTTRSVAPTEAGARLLQRLAPALVEIAGALDQLHASEGEVAGTLRINAPVPAVDLVLAPMLGPFLAEHPRLRLELVTEAALVDIVEAGFDAGVRWGEDLAQDMVAVSLSGPQRFAIVAAPAVIARWGMPERPEELQGRPCIRQLFPGGIRPPWEFERDGRIVRIDADGPLLTTSLAAKLRAACDGAGFCGTFEDYVTEDIAAGRLVRVLDDWCAPFPGPFLYYPRHRHTPAPLRAFVDFVRRWRR